MDSNSDEVISLRRTTRDIIAISSLPSIWAHYGIPQIAESLSETLHRSLALELAVVLISGHEEKISAAFCRSGLLKDSALAAVISSLSGRVDKDSSVASTEWMPNPVGEGLLRVNFTPIGYNFKNGVLVTAATRSQFPSESDRLILNIASNQTNVIIESKWSRKAAEKLLVLAEEKEARLKEATKLAETAQAEAEHANELKSSFLANMSHEIRTPLGVILGFADILKSPALEPTERNEYLDIISRNGQALTRIIDDILDLSKVEAGKLEIESSLLSLPDLCQEVITMFADRATGKGIALTLDTSELPQFNILSDPARIRQVLVNLIGNAIKFTSQGSVEVRGSFIEVAPNSLRISIFVKDTGIGMSQTTAATLFRPFIQGDNTSTRKFGGTGLGLSLSRKLGNALGGNVSLFGCEENKGCTFQFEFEATIPDMVEKNFQPRGNAKAFAKERLAGYKILIADDSSENRLMMKIVLTEQGAQAEFANDGEEAVEKTLRGDFDLVLMDIQMPKLDGYAALSKLRKQGFQKPIFALTAHAMKEERDRAIAAGFVDHLAKPINPQELVASILTHVARP